MSWLNDLLKGNQAEPTAEPQEHAGRVYRAERAVINLGVLVLLSEIVGDEKLAQLLDNRQARITVGQKRRILIEILGYEPAVADSLDPEMFDGEMSLFFTRWLQKSLQGQLSSAMLPLSDGKLPTQILDNISRLRNS